jgi:hypothetical protein
MEEKMPLVSCCSHPAQMAFYGFFLEPDQSYHLRCLWIFMEEKSGKDFGIIFEQKRPSLPT